MCLKRYFSNVVNYTYVLLSLGMSLSNFARSRRNTPTNDAPTRISAHRSAHFSSTKQMPVLRTNANANVKHNTMSWDHAFEFLCQPMLSINLLKDYTKAFILLLTLH